MKSRTFENTARWLRDKRREIAVRRWLRHQGDGGDRLAGEALWKLNRHVRTCWREGERYRIYGLKTHVIRVLYEKRDPQVGLRFQKLECWSCYGSGVWRQGTYYEEPCWKCGGDGVYREHVLFEFEFEIGGQRYVWHQPRDIVLEHYSPRVTALGVPEYQSEGQAHAPIGDDTYVSFLCAVLAGYVLNHGGAEGRGSGYVNLHPLAQALRWDLRGIWYRTKRRLPRPAVEMRWTSGRGVDEEDSIPF